MRPCPTCGEYLMNDGLSFNEGVSAALIGGDRKRTHKCLPKWEFLVGECAKAGVILCMIAAASFPLTKRGH